ncbi:MAG: hypothetical protein AVDCRST_MAG28-1075 [uncultured Rubrobacteraceae bacterium]|uniref:Uncharacterized protein n=1 Tax=uncultured Rubrobacteraceae bacterium TaxID=349277 RepID=A0A6J4QR52_9ACTN|nr:MAG: hypothetical protein AVDCRST_MAG28-1075 [uncultured Rubrobacteraceae bacterium]
MRIKPVRLYKSSRRFHSLDVPLLFQSQIRRG